MSRLHLLLVFILFLFSISTSSAKVIDFKEQYQDYLGITYSYTNENLALHPMYSITDNGSNYTISRMGTTVTIPKRAWIDYNFYPDRIQPVITIQNFSQINQLVTKVNASVWYLTFPWSASKTKSVTDDLIDMGVFKRSIKLDVTDNNGSSYGILPKVVGGNIRFYFNPQTYLGVVYPLTITENTIIVNNATTSGFSSANVSMNGSAWTGQNNGGLRINQRNDSQLNMTGLVASWNCDEQSGTQIHNVNTESGLINATNEGTYNGNATLNYSSGKIGNACSFDGVNDYVDVGTISLNNTWTISSWIYIVDTAHNSIAGDLNSTYGFVIINLTSTRMTFEPSSVDGKGGSFINAGFGIILLNNWSYVTLVIQNDLGYAYLNGKLLVSSALASNISDLVVQYIGRGYTGLPGSYMNGSIDEVRIWNRALSASEIAVLYNTSIRTYGNVTFSMQNTSGVNVSVNRTRITVTNSGQNNNTMNLSVKPLNSSAWTLLMTNVSSNTWYSLPAHARSNSMSFMVEFNGNGSDTPFFTSLEWDESSSGIGKPDWAVGYYLAGGAAIAGALYGAYRRRMRSNQMIVYSFFGGKDWHTLR